MKPIDISQDTAIFSDCKKYRYVLTRNFLNAKPGICNFLMLNPSTANHKDNDKTVTRCCKYAQKWGYGRMIVTNIFAFVETKKELMKKYHAPIGDENNAYIIEAAKMSSFIVCAWGTDGEHLDRGKAVQSMLSELKLKPHCLVKTKDGHPKHPLYCKGDLKPIPYEGAT